MVDNKKNEKVNLYFTKLNKWDKELEKLRKIILGCGLEEDFKWGKPCYTIENKNVILLFSFKDTCAIGFLKGSLLTDDKKVLVKPGENSLSMRFIKFSQLEEIETMQNTIINYLYEAIENEKTGLEVNFIKKTQLEIPYEFQVKLEQIPALKIAFNSLTPGRQKAYILYFNQPKQTKTRISRIEKCLPQILNKKGLND